MIYEPWTPAPKQRAILEEAKAELGKYEADGYALTSRQLYYRLREREIVSEGREAEERLSYILNRARLSGRLDWRHCRDTLPRTHDRATSFNVVAELWVQREAVVDQVLAAAEPWRVNVKCLRGYAPTTVIHEWCDHLHHFAPGVKILHVADWTDTGRKMTGDLENRVHMFAPHATVERVDFGPAARDYELEELTPDELAHRIHLELRYLLGDPA
jgi:hypothetical protein